MSIVAVHGPNTMFTTQAGGTSIPSSGGGVAQATKSSTNGLTYSFSVPNPGARPAADFDWTFTGPGSPVAQTDRFSGTVTYTGAGAGTIVLTVAAGAGPPAGGTYTIITAPTVGTPRSVQKDDDDEAPGVYDADGSEEPVPEGLLDHAEGELQVGFDPAAHSVSEVEEYAEAHPDQAELLYEAEAEGKNRVTLLTFLESLIPFDPSSYTIDDVKAYVEDNPDEAIDVLNQEREGKNRSTLVSYLEEISSVE